MQPSRIQASPNKRIKDGRKLLNINWKYGGSLTSFFEQSFKDIVSEITNTDEENYDEESCDGSYFLDDTTGRTG